MGKEFNYGELLKLTNKEFADYIQNEIDAHNAIREVMGYRVRVDRNGLNEEEIFFPEDQAPIVVVDVLSGWRDVPLALWTYWFHTHTKRFDRKILNKDDVDRFHAMEYGVEELPELGHYPVSGSRLTSEGDPLTIGISYTDYMPGMFLYLHQDHESLKEGDIVRIEEVSGFDAESGTYKPPREYFFITEDGTKILWNKVAVSCYIERNETTSFIEKMYDHYRSEADRRMKDVGNYEWKQDNYDAYLEGKYTTLLEMLVEYEHNRLKQMKKEYDEFDPLLGLEHADGGEQDEGSN